MELHHQSPPGVLDRAVEQQLGLPRFGFFHGGSFAGENLLERCVQRGLRETPEADVIQPVIRRTAAVGGKIGNAIRQGALHVLNVSERIAHSLQQLLNVRRKAWFVELQCFIRAEGGADLYREVLICRQFFVPLQTVAGIVRGADHLHIAAANEATGGEIRAILQLLIAELPDLTGGVLRQEALPAEVVFQL